MALLEQGGLKRGGPGGRAVPHDCSGAEGRANGQERSKREGTRIAVQMDNDALGTTLRKYSFTKMSGHLPK